MAQLDSFSIPPSLKCCKTPPLNLINNLLNNPKQRRIHGYPSRVRVGRGSDEIDQLDSLAGAVTPKPPINAEKS